MTRVAGEIDALKQGLRQPTSLQRQSRTVSYHEIDFVAPWRDLRMIFDDYVDLAEGIYARSRQGEPIRVLQNLRTLFE